MCLCSAVRGGPVQATVNPGGTTDGFVDDGRGEKGEGAYITMLEGITVQSSSNMGWQH